jgi:hypothetical protein
MSRQRSLPSTVGQLLGEGAQGRRPRPSLPARTTPCSDQGHGLSGMVPNARPLMAHADEDWPGSGKSMASTVTFPSSP